MLVRHLIRYALLVCISAVYPSIVTAGQIPIHIPAMVADRLSRGMAQDLIVLFDDRDVEAEAASLRKRDKIAHDDNKILALRRIRYRSIKQATTAGFLLHEVDELRDFDHLPLSFVRIKNRAVLERLLADSRVQAIYEDLPVYPHLAYSLPFIGQPAVTGTGLTGGGTTVAVIDTGINYTLPVFGSCTTPGTPVGCRVVASVDVTGNNLALNTDPKGHGTNVSGIVAGVAPSVQIAAINAFSAGTSSTSWIIAGINWAIANKNVYNISALNMSLGDNSNNAAPCGNGVINPYVTPINNLRSAGVIPVSSSGNSAFATGMSSPACTPGVVSVGAVYDANWSGPYTWSSGCTDSTSGADKIPCFSNSASFLTILAPGAFITAAGIQMAGTSQAAPHVAGAVALLRAAYPSDTLLQAVDRLTSSGVPVTDSRNGVIKPRLNLLVAIGAPANNVFAQRSTLSGDSGHLTSHNLNATKESGEPLHAGNSGGKSVWWRWTPSTSGAAAFNTHGSTFDTLLSIYSGSTLAGLSQVAANDNDGSSGNNSGITFTALAGNEYLIAVDGYNSAAGAILLNWSLVQQADLGIMMSQSPAAPIAGGDITYTLFVTNHGPSAASGVMVTDQLPTGVTFVSASSGCSLSGGTVSCGLGTLVSDASVSIQVIVTTPVAGVLTNTVQVSSLVIDPQFANDSTSATVIVSPVAAVPAFSAWGLGFVALCLAGLAGTGNNRRNDR